jgi:hypothetical protein
MGGKDYYQNKRDMTPEKFDDAERLKNQIDSHKKILNLLKGYLPPDRARGYPIELTGTGRVFTLPDRLVDEFIHATQHSLNKLETEFNEL